MGFPMAGHVARAGYDISVYNRSPEKAAAWQQQYGGAVAATAQEAAEGADVVMLCLPTDDDVRQVVSTIAPHLKEGAVLVDHGSGGLSLARELTALAAESNFDFLDAPVTGGSGGAVAGTLAVMVGGDADVLSKVKPVLQCFGKSVVHMGGPGAGYVTKMINVIIGHVTGLAVAEGIGFAIKSGLDPAKVVDVLLQGSSRSWVMENRSGPMISRDYRTKYPVTFARKDLGNVLKEARAVNAPLPGTALVDQIYGTLIRDGFGTQDAASLIEFFAPNHGDSQ